MPPKKPIAKPKPIARRGAAAAAAGPQQPGDAPTATGGEPSNSASSSSSTAVAPEVFMAPIAPMASVAPMALPAPPPAEPAAPAAPASEPSSTTPAPVETKEATPIAPPKGRLDSLTSSSRGGLGGIRGGASKLKFQPKVIPRRTREERENLDAKFQAEQAAAAAAEGSERPRGGSGIRARGGRGGRGRSRGGRGGFDMPVGASGPFALGSIVTAGQQKVMAERGPNFVKSSRSFSSYKSRIKSESAGGEDSKRLDYSSSEESDGQRMDVEYISLLDDNPSEDEGGDKNMDNEWGAGAPIRVPRSEHIDRQVLVNTDSSSKKGKAELKAKEKEMTFETDIKIKDEPEDDDVMISSSSPELSKQKVKISESSPERKKKQPSEFSSPKKPRPKKKPIISTTEEKEEFERIEIDKMHALHELGGGTIEPIDAKGKAKDTEGDVDMLSPTAPKRNSETENQIFFFQFPPLLPHLVPMDTPTKEEPNPEDPDVKPEPSSAVPTKKSILKVKALLKSQLALLTAPPPPGLVGKLRVHKSGRISLLWGNPDENGEGVMEMEVNRGAPCEFLQEVVVMKDQSPYGDQDVDEKGRPKGVAYSLGQVKGKYVVSPDFAGLIKASNGKKPTAAGKGKEKEKKVEIVVDE